MATALYLLAIIFLSSLCVALAMNLREANRSRRILAKQLADNLTRLLRNKH